MALPKGCVRFSRENHSASEPAKPPHQESLSEGGFVVYNDSFLPILGATPSLRIVLSNPAYPFAHEAGVYIPLTGEVFITSNRHQISGHQHVQISKFRKVGDKYECEEIRPDVPMGNGGVNYQDGVLFCAQGTHTDPGGLIYMSRHAPYETQTIVNNYHGRWFNSVNDVVVHSDGSIWFTDPCYGFEQAFRPLPELPCQVYRYDPQSGTGDIRVVADGFGKPNGICFAPDEKTAYVTDTNAIQCVHGAGVYRPDKQSTIYAFDVVYRHEKPFLVNRRVFAMADTGIPDGIKCDLAGNVYSGCGDGVNVWSPGGSLVGKIYVPGGCANFCFGRDGEMFLLNENKVWRAQLGERTKGALLGI